MWPDCGSIDRRFVEMLFRWIRSYSPHYSGLHDPVVSRLQSWELAVGLTGRQHFAKPAQLDVRVRVRLFRG
jgi:hypothetical protein